jgi:hypothetical protein
MLEVGPQRLSVPVQTLYVILKLQKLGLQTQKLSCKRKIRRDKSFVWSFKRFVLPCQAFFFSCIRSSFPTNHTGSPPRDLPFAAIHLLTAANDPGGPKGLYLTSQILSFSQLSIPFPFRLIQERKISIHADSEDMGNGGWVMR